MHREYAQSLNPAVVSNPDQLHKLYNTIRQREAALPGEQELIVKFRAGELPAGWTGGINRIHDCKCNDVNAVDA